MGKLCYGQPHKIKPHRHGQHWALLLSFFFYKSMILLIRVGCPCWKYLFGRISLSRRPNNSSLMRTDWVSEDSWNCILNIRKFNTIIHFYFFVYVLNYPTVKPLIINTSKKSIKCRLDIFSLGLTLFYLNLSICENK